jgi:hypothetical protein
VRRLRWPGLVGLLTVLALVPAFVSVIGFGSDGGPRLLPDPASLRPLLTSQAIAVAIIVGTITWLRWWPAVVHETNRTRRWIWLVPVSLLSVALVLADWGRVRQAGPALTVAVLVGAMLIAVSEELAYRGVLLTFLRDRTTEARAAWLSSLVFGGAHLVVGPAQAVLSAAFGYLLYLTRRVSGGIVLPMVVHAAWDAAVFTSFTTQDPAVGSDAAVALSLITLVLIVVVIAARHRIDAPHPPARAVRG